MVRACQKRSCANNQKNALSSCHHASFFSFWINVFSLRFLSLTVYEFAAFIIHARVHFILFLRKCVEFGGLVACVWLTLKDAAHSPKAEAESSQLIKEAKILKKIN